MDKLPDGFPTLLKGPMVWKCEDFTGKPESYIDEFTADDVCDLKRAIAHFKNLGLTRGYIDPQTFPLPASLSQKLGQIKYTLNNGRGFQVVRGIDPLQFDEEEQVILFVGISAHVASQRAGHLDHIRHEKKDEDRGEHLRPTELPVSMGFHTDADAGNILAMFMETMATSGGGQFLSSAWQAYNVLMHEDPAVLADLARDWYWEKPNLALGGQAYNSFCRAVMGQVDGKVEVNFGRSFVAGHPKYPLSLDAPGLTEQQEASLCAFVETAAHNSLRLDTRAGDLVGDGSAGRHLLRLWMRDAETSWPIASELKYQSEHLWDVPPEAQKLYTVTEWEAVPRSIRVKSVGTAMSHD